MTESFSCEKFIETNNILALRGKNLFLLIASVKTRNSIVSN